MFVKSCDLGDNAGDTLKADEINLGENGVLPLPFRSIVLPNTPLIWLMDGNDSSFF